MRGVLDGCCECVQIGVDRRDHAFCGYCRPPRSRRRVWWRARKISRGVMWWGWCSRRCREPPPPPLCVTITPIVRDDPASAAAAAARCDAIGRSDGVETAAAASGPGVARHRERAPDPGGSPASNRTVGCWRVAASNRTVGCWRVAGSSRDRWGSEPDRARFRALRGMSRGFGSFSRRSAPATVGQ